MKQATKAWLNRLASSLGYKIVSSKHYEQLFPCGPWGVKLEPYLRHTISNLDSVRVCFDVGANIGQTALELANLFPHASIYSFEPVQTTFSELQSNTRHVTRIIPSPVALGAQPCFAQISVSGNSQVAKIQTADQKNEPSVTEQISIITATEFVFNNSIDHIHLLKTDTEGYDLQVLQGAQELMASARIDLIYSEAGFQTWDQWHTSLVSLLDYLPKFGYNFVGLFDMAYDCNPPHAAFGNALFAHKETRLMGPWKW